MNTSFKTSQESITHFSRLEGIAPSMPVFRRRASPGNSQSNRWIRWLVLLGAICITLTPAARADDAADITALDKIVFKFYSAGKYSEAIPFAEKLLRLREKVFGPQHPETALSLNNLALLYKETGDWAKAEPLYQRGLAIREKALGPMNSGITTNLDNLASLYETKGDYAKAQPLFERSLAIKQKEFGPLNPETAQGLNNLASLYENMGYLPKAELLFQNALAIREKTLGRQNPDTATSLNNLAVLYQEMGDYSKAEPLYLSALAVSERIYGPVHSETATALNNVALLYEHMGDYAKAEPLCRRALAIREKVLGPLHPDTASSVTNLALLCENLGDYARAEPLYQRALAICEKALGPLHPGAAVSLNNLALLYVRLGDYAKAEPLYQRAIAIKERTLGPLHPSVATGLNNLAMLYLAVGDYVKAEPLLRRALAIREKTLGAEHPDTAGSLNNLALLFSAMGDYAKAEPLFQHALAIREKALGSRHPETANSLVSLAFLDVALGKQAYALELARRAEKVSAANLGDILSFTSEQQRLAFQKKSDPFMLLATLGSAPDIAAVVLHNKGVVLDSLLEDRLVAEASQNAAHLNTIAQIRTAKQRLTQLLMEAPKDLSPQAIRRRDAELETRTREVEQLESGLARQVAGLGKARRALSVTVEQVQGALASGQSLVELLRYEHYLGKSNAEARYGAVVFATTGETTWVSLGSAAEIEKNVATYEKCMRGEAGESAEAKLTTTLQILYDELWAPIEKALPPGIKTVILSPDGDLNFVSFATLLAPDNQFLAEKYSIRYVASGRDLLREISPSASKSMTIFGNPDFGSQMKLARNRSAVTAADALRGFELRDFNRITLPPLPGTGVECAALKAETATLGTQSQVFLGADATEAQLNRVVSPRILHLATHGFFLPDPTDPQAGNTANVFGMQQTGFTGSDAQQRQALLKNPMHRSGLALAGAQHTLDAWAKGEAPPSDNDGIVTAEEVGGLKLEGTWLVTLSACDTGAGEARAGEGVMGLRRGFIQAGAQNLLMTLWEISDDTTVDIMKDFYARALKTGNAPQALADTQREWLVKLRKEKGLAEAVALAGPFIMSSQGKP